MAVWAEWNQITYWVDHVPGTKLRDGGDVVNLYDTCGDCPVPGPHFEAARLAGRAMYRDRSCTIPTIPFIATGLNRCQRPFRISDNVELDTLACLFRREDRDNGRGKPPCPATDDASIRFTFIYTQFQLTLVH